MSIQVINNSLSSTALDPSLSCVMCQATTAKKWHKGPAGNTQVKCNSCYVKILALKRAQRTDRTCTDCLTTSSKRWIHDPLAKDRFKCRRCYEKVVAEKTTTITDRTCSRCFVTSSTRWDKDPLDKTKFACNSCYQKVMAVKRSAARNAKHGLRCCECLVTHSRRWNRDVIDKTKFKCYDCYSKIIHEKSSVTTPSNTDISDYPITATYKVPVLEGDDVTADLIGTAVSASSAAASIGEENQSLFDDFHEKFDKGLDKSSDENEGFLLSQVDNPITSTASSSPLPQVMGFDDLFYPLSLDDELLNF